MLRRTGVIPGACLVVAPLLGSAAFAQCGAVTESNEPTDAPPALVIRVTDVAAADFKQLAGASVRAREQQLTACWATAMWGPVAAGVGFDYQYTRFTYSNVPSRNRDLHRVQWPLFVSWQNGGIRIRSVIAPGLATSSNAIKDPFRRIDSTDVLTTGRVTIQSAADRGIGWEVGVAHDRRFGDPQWYPVAGIVYRPNAKTTLRLVLPEPSIEWRLGERTAIHAAAYPAGSTWHVYADDFESNFRYRLRGVRTEITARQRLWRQLHVDFSVGWETHRQHRFDAAPTMRVRSDADDALVIGLSLRLGAPARSHTHYPGS